MFKCCRRAWDLGSRCSKELRARAAYAGVRPTRPYEALALYFPMWEWNRDVVVP
jgi:hypothetical protein